MRTPALAALDRALLDAALRAGARRLDPAAGLLTAQAHYNPIHTTIHTGTVHPYRESAAYALLLLEDGRAGADSVLRAVLAGQDTNPASRTYGLWPYVAEEPLGRMRPPDWNWADFLGSKLLLIERRHGGRLAPDVRAGVRGAIAHAAASVRRRDVSPGYTNIAVKGTFVVLAAAEALGDAELRAYAAGRLRRLARHIDASGSFAEYNSPTYGWVTLTDLERIRAHVDDPWAAAVATAIRDRYWLHLVRHWHPPSRQVAGPMSRCYSTGLAGTPQFRLMLHKATGGRLPWVAAGAAEEGCPLDGGTGGPGGPPAPVPEELASGHTAMTAYGCPEELVEELLALHAPRQHREVFAVGGPQGTTWLEPALALGTLDRGDLWVQRRPVLGTWAGGWMRLRAVLARGGGDASAGGAPEAVPAPPLPDAYDFASGHVFAVQERRRALVAVGFMSPGGERHVGIDRITGGRFRARRISVGFEIAGPVRVVGREGGRLRLEAAAGSGTGGGSESTVRVELALLAAGWGAARREAVLRDEAGALWFGTDLLDAPQAVDVDWQQVRTAFTALSVWLAPGGQPWPAPAGAAVEGQRVSLCWEAAPALALAAPIWVGEAGARAAAVEAAVGDAPVPPCRLADAPLAGSAG